jgi:hypothetical protein
MDDVFEIDDSFQRVVSCDFDSCIIGTCKDSGKPIYSSKKCIKQIQKINHFSQWDATDFFTSSFLNCNFGINTPIWCIDHE